MSVTVEEAKSGVIFDLPVRDGERALDVFHHPYAYAAIRRFRDNGDDDARLRVHASNRFRSALTRGRCFGRAADVRTGECGPEGPQAAGGQRAGRLAVRACPSPNRPAGVSTHPWTSHVRQLAVRHPRGTAHHDRSAHRTAANRSGARLMLTCQSRFGRARWLQPYTIATVKALAKKGVKNLVVITPGFSADCLETLEEIAVENAYVFKRYGGENFAAIPCLNDSEAGMLMIWQLAMRELKGWV